MNTPQAPNPLDNPDGFLRWLEFYLRPRAMGGAGKRAHQFTINGLTYPFVRYYNFAAVPDPPLERRYDMYSGLHLALPGDLLFFFQADPQDPYGDINSRRGIRGIYRVCGYPHRASTPVQDKVSGVGYTILDRCPSCSTHHATFSRTCPECGVGYPEIRVRGTENQTARVLASHLDIEPLFAFERSVSDERAYADLSDPGLIWIGRHDNAMGPGKGSSIRHLLPEEAVKLARLLIHEPDQGTGAKHNPPNLGQSLPLTHRNNGRPIDELPTDANGLVSREDELYFLITRQLFTPRSPLRNAFVDLLPSRITWDHLEYASSTFPWGYTAGTADYVLIFRNDTGRRLIVIIECKRDSAHDETILQTLLYVERVLQVSFFSALPGMVPSEEQPVEVLPVIIARRARRPRGMNPKVAIPAPYALRRSYFSGVSVRAVVRSPLFLLYVPPPGTSSLRPLQRFTFQPLPSSAVGEIDWAPPLGAVGTMIELNWILETSWASARAAAGLGHGRTRPTPEDLERILAEVNLTDFD